MAENVTGQELPLCIDSPLDSSAKPIEGSGFSVSAGFGFSAAEYSWISF